VKVILKQDGRTASGGTALIMHNERLADPLDSFTRSLAEVSKKRGKTIEDHLEIGRREFLGGLYTTPISGPQTMEMLPDGSVSNGVPHVPCLPAWNVIRCLQDGATRQKKGKDVQRGIMPLSEHATLTYDGPDDPEDLWRAGFGLRKTVGVQRARTVRTRPMFLDWQAELPVEVDLAIFDIDTLRKAWADAGRYAGIGDMRPVYGKFVGTVEVPAGRSRLTWIQHPSWTGSPLR
jgi:hypothetical protein